MVMTWGGLRGAVGLALAIQVHNGRAPDKDGNYMISQGEADRVLFFVSGVAFLTMIVNATTAPALVRKLGITALPAAKRRLMKLLYQRLLYWSVDKANPEAVTRSLRAMMNEVEEHLELDSCDGPAKPTIRHRIRKRSNTIQNGMMLAEKSWMSQPNNELVSEHKMSAQFHEARKEEDLRLLPDLPEQSLLGKTAHMYELLEKSVVDPKIAKAVNTVFCNIVCHDYWKQIDDGNLRPGAPETDALLTSTRQAVSPLTVDLRDLDCLCQGTDLYRCNSGVGVSKVHPEVRLPSNEDLGSWELGGAEAATNGVCYRIMHSRLFVSFIFVVIVLNSLHVGLEEAVRKEDDNHPIWLVLEVIFTSIFVVEFVLKFIVLRLKYFLSAWNCFDFLLVVLGVGGLIIDTQVTAAADTARILRISRIFRVLRFLRIFRIFHAKMSNDKDVSEDTAKHMQRLTMLVSFIHAHINAEILMVKYFGGGNGKIDDENEKEIARCIVQSQVAVYKAIELAIVEVNALPEGIMRELKWVQQRKAITESLEKFVMSAYSDGAISAREADSILAPLAHQITKCMAALDNTYEGIVVKGLVTGPKQRRVSMFDAGLEAEDALSPTGEASDDIRVEDASPPPAPQEVSPTLK